MRWPQGHRWLTYNDEKDFRQMTPDQRWLEIDRELAELWQGKVVQGGPIARETGLRTEQNRLEWEVGDPE